MTRIPVQATAASGFAPLDALALDLMMVTQDGNIAKELGRFPVTGGAAEVPDVPLADPALRWAIRIVDTALGVPVYRSGPLGFLPGGPRSRIFGDRIRLHRGGGNLGLDAPDGAPQVLVDFVRDNLPGAFQMRSLDLGADVQGRYVLTLRVRYRPLPVIDVDIEYRRGFGIAPGIDAGRPRRVAVAWPQGPGTTLPSPLQQAAEALDTVLAGGVEAQMSAMAFHIGFLMLFAEGVTDLTPQTVSLTSIQIRPSGNEVDASVALVSGAVNGGIRVFDPVPVVVERASFSPSPTPPRAGRTPATPR
ncbi:MAG TPA: hypothetical protein VFG74_12100 [Miltoncostaeaceae bacterium]|nr:hypothetical protein [Miltoncostaeaceae bacterium]